MWLQTVKFIAKKSKCAVLAQEIGFSAPYSWNRRGWWKAQYSCAPPKKSVINWTWLRLSIFDWSIITIGPGGLLLVVPMYMQFSLQFYWWGCRKIKHLNYDISFYYPEWHTEHRWRCSKLPWKKQQVKGQLLFLLFSACVCVGYMCWEFVLLTRIELSIRYPKLGTSSPQFSPKLETKKRDQGEKVDREKNGDQTNFLANIGPTGDSYPLFGCYLHLDYFSYSSLNPALWHIRILKIFRTHTQFHETVPNLVHVYLDTQI
jgi:hypothetical protein